jgi:hypothetical protein
MEFPCFFFVVFAFNQKSSCSSQEEYTWGNVCFEGGGFVSGLVTCKTQPGLIYARTDVGGAYRWDSTEGRWIPLMDAVSQIPGAGIRLTDLRGRTVRLSAISHGKSVLDLAGLRQGMYLAENGAAAAKIYIVK